MGIYITDELLNCIHMALCPSVNGRCGILGDLTEHIIAGADEAGRGPLAGPVTGACVVLPVGYEHKYLKDSKKLTALQRESAFVDIVNSALAFSVVCVGNRRIDLINIRQASRLAMKLAAFRVHRQLFGEAIINPNFWLLIDGNMGLDTGFNETTIIKGDAKVKEISAASILAKVTRDWLMSVLDNKYPGYGLNGHKGYPTKAHLNSISTLGPTCVHRKTFKGVK